MEWVLAGEGVFESLVNLEGCKTIEPGHHNLSQFESLVNLEGCKTLIDGRKFRLSFESLVNLEGCKTFRRWNL